MKTLNEPTAGIILAAGTSQRLGRPKQLIELQGKTILQWSMESALSSNLERVFVVLGYDRSNILSSIHEITSHQKLEILCNEKYAQGMGTSLALGISQIKDTFKSAMFLLGDQPLFYWQE